MRAMMIEAPGGPEALQLRDVPMPEPAAGEALVRLHAAGVNFVDVGQRRSGANIPGGLPAILGREGAGEVVALGPGAEHVRVGNRVAFAPIQRAYAEYIAAPAEKLIPLPDAVDWITGAATPLQAMTAHYLIHTLHRTEPGETVLIHAAAGGVVGRATVGGTAVGGIAVGGPRMISLARRPLVTTPLRNSIRPLSKDCTIRCLPGTPAYGSCRPSFAVERGP